MMITPTQIRVTEDRRQDLLAAAVRARFVAIASQPAPCTPRPPASRIQTSLRQTIAALVALASIA